MKPVDNPNTCSVFIESQERAGKSFDTRCDVYKRAFADQYLIACGKPDSGTLFTF